MDIFMADDDPEEFDGFTQEDIKEADKLYWKVKKRNDAAMRRMGVDTTQRPESGELMFCVGNVTWTSLFNLRNYLTD